MILSRKLALALVTAMQAAIVALWNRRELLHVAPDLPQPCIVLLALIGGIAIDYAVIMTVQMHVPARAWSGRITAAVLCTCSAGIALDLFGVLPFDGRWLHSVYPIAVFAFTLHAMQYEAACIRASVQDPAPSVQPAPAQSPAVQPAKLSAADMARAGATVQEMMDAGIARNTAESAKRRADRASNVTALHKSVS